VALYFQGVSGCQAATLDRFTARRLPLTAYRSTARHLPLLHMQFAVFGFAVFRNR